MMMLMVISVTSVPLPIFRANREVAQQEPAGSRCAPAVATYTGSVPGVQAGEFRVAEGIEACDEFVEHFAGVLVASGRLSFEWQF